MYSLLLMSAVAAGPDAAAFGWRAMGSCTGCSGAVASCYGSSCYGSCSGSACYGSSCYGSSCYGSSCSGYSCGGGGLFHGGLMGRFRGGRASCNGCTGTSCHGSSCYGSCYGSAYGTGCYGSCYGGGCHGAGCVGTVVAPGATVVPAGQPVEIAPTSSIAAPKASASLTIELPAAATLFVDGVATTTTGAARQFHTPDLEPGQAFFYDFKAQVVVDGKVETEEKRVVVRSGTTTTESFAKLFAAVKAANSADVVAASK